MRANGTDGGEEGDVDVGWVNVKQWKYTLATKKKILFSVESGRPAAATMCLQRRQGLDPLLRILKRLEALS